MDQEMDKDFTDCQDESVIDIVQEGNIADEDSDTEQHENEHDYQQEEPKHEMVVFSEETKGSESSIEAAIGNKEKDVYLQENEQSFKEMRSNMKDGGNEEESNAYISQELELDRVDGKEADHEDTETAIGANEINSIHEESELNYTDMDQEMEDIIDEAIDKHVNHEQGSDEIIADVTDESGKKM